MLECEHLGYFHFLAILDEAAVNIHVRVSVWTYVSFLGGVYLGVDLLGHMVILCLVFEKLPDCFPEWLHHLTFPPAV